MCSRGVQKCEGSHSNFQKCGGSSPSSLQNVNSPRKPTSSGRGPFWLLAFWKMWKDPDVRGKWKGARCAYLGVPQSGPKQNVVWVSYLVSRFFTPTRVPTKQQTPISHEFFQRLSFFSRGTSISLVRTSPKVAVSMETTSQLQLLIW